MSQIKVKKGLGSLRQPDIDDIFRNKFQYFTRLLGEGIEVISYEEFILLKDFVLAQFDEVVIEQDNRFINLFPAITTISQDVYQSLEYYFSEEREEDSQKDFSPLQKYLGLFTNVVNIDDRYFVSYADDFLDTTSVMIKTVYLYQNDGTNLHNEVFENQKVFDIVDENDYLRLLKTLESFTFDDVFVSVEGTEFALDFIVEKLSLLGSIYRNKTDIHLTKYAEYKKKKYDNEPYLDILKKYWKRDSFLKLSVYDMNALDEGEIKTYQVTQDDIMNDLVDQVELCRVNKSFRDVFVTAPTGAGKSAIFQVPAIYLAEKYELLTIVISPLVGLMNDQVDNLNQKGYHYSRTINSQISPVTKSQIRSEIESNQCHILYLSPESLLGRSDLENLIGNRTLGMIVVDEAHIVTTWGKQFRPDYWYLGDHIQKQRKTQFQRKQQSFVVATFTATAIYRGIEDMYGETKSSLHLINPITYLGEVKRQNLEIEVTEVEREGRRVEYELNKFSDLTVLINKSLLYGNKTLIYFPTKKLIDRFKTHLILQKMHQHATVYHGGLSKEDRLENNAAFKSGDCKIMLATKAYGMGIDIEDIVNVIHFAPTGNVCDYVQEIGRAARRRDITGHAVYHYMDNDFKYINMLHGLSVIKDYHLVQVMKKIVELYKEQLKKDRVGKQNAMMVDAQSFTYIFENPFFGEEDVINKVKTALLLIQKNFMNTRGFTPFRARPMPLFTTGYFHIPNEKLALAKNILDHHMVLVNNNLSIYELNLERIWKSDADLQKLSFPQFKYNLYSASKDLEKYNVIDMKQAIRFEVSFNTEHSKVYTMYFQAIRKIITALYQTDKYYTQQEIAHEIASSTKKSPYMSNAVAEVIVKSISSYMEYVNTNPHSKPMTTQNRSGEQTYRFSSEMDEYFNWINHKYQFFLKKVEQDHFYIINNGNNSTKEYNLALGILESWGVLSFNALGGANSQIYVYINQTQTMLEYIERPYTYKNRILSLVDERHKTSVAMMKYLFGSKFTSDEIWKIVEEYFLGRLPYEVEQIKQQQ